MSEAKFTKGEWVIDKPAGSNGWVNVCLSGCSWSICTTYGSNDNDAHLIAAAPKMYNKLEELYLISCVAGDDDPIYDEIKELLAKARGEHE